MSARRLCCLCWTHTSSGVYSVACCMPLLCNNTCYGILLHNLPLLLWPSFIKQMMHVLSLWLAVLAEVCCLICTPLLSVEALGCMSCKVFASVLSSDTPAGLISCLIGPRLHLPQLMSLLPLLLVCQAGCAKHQYAQQVALPARDAFCHTALQH